LAPPPSRRLTKTCTRTHSGVRACRKISIPAGERAPGGFVHRVIHMKCRTDPHTGRDFPKVIPRFVHSRSRGAIDAAGPAAVPSSPECGAFGKQLGGRGGRSPREPRRAPGGPALFFPAVTLPAEPAVLQLTRSCQHASRSGLLSVRDAGTRSSLAYGDSRPDPPISGATGEPTARSTGGPPWPRHTPVRPTA
jgi:hypothetical protein